MDNDISFEIVTLVNPSNDPFDIVYNNRVFRTIPAGKAMRLPKRPFGILAEKHLIDRMCNGAGESTMDQAARAKWREKIVIEENFDNSDAPLDPNELLARKLDKINGTNDSGQVATCDTCGTKTFNLPEHIALNHPATPLDADGNKTAPVATAVGTLPAQPTAQVAPIEPVLPTPPAPQPPVEILSATDPATMPIIKPQPTTEAQKDVANVVASITGVTKGEGMVLAEQKADEVETPATYAPPYGDTPTREQLIAYARSINVKVDDDKTKAFLETADLEAIKKELNYGI